MDPNEQDTAHHEGAHSVAAVVLGMAIDHASIEANAESYGRALLRFPPPNLTHQLTWALAGPLASRRLSGLDLACESGDLDIQHCQKALADKYGTAALVEVHKLPEFKQAAILATDIVTDFWPAIRRVAAILLRSRRVAGHVVELIVTEHESRYSPRRFVA